LTRLVLNEKILPKCEPGFSPRNNKIMKAENRSTNAWDWRKHEAVISGL